MLPVKVLVCPIDFSEPCFFALKAACELAAHFAAELRLVNVVPAVPGLPTDPNYVFKIPEYERLLHVDADQRLRDVVETRVPKELKVKCIIGHGDAASEIVRISNEEKADLIVISTHGESGLRRLWFGWVAENVVRRATGPVLTIREPDS